MAWLPRRFTLRNGFTRRFFEINTGENVPSAFACLVRWRFASVQKSNIQMQRLASLKLREFCTGNANPSPLISPKRLLGLTRRSFKIVLRFGEAILGNLLLGGECFGAIQLSLQPSPFHLFHHAFGGTGVVSGGGGVDLCNMGLVSAYCTPDHSDEGQNARKPDQPLIKFKLLLLVFLITAFSFASFILKLIEADVENGDSAFVVNYAPVLGLFLVGQFICYLILKKTSRIETRKHPSTGKAPKRWRTSNGWRQRFYRLRRKRKRDRLKVRLPKEEGWASSSFSRRHDERGCPGFAGFGKPGTTDLDLGVRPLTL